MLRVVNLTNSEIGFTLSFIDNVIYKAFFKIKRKSVPHPHDRALQRDAFR
jgi:hypothetical protein